MNTRIFASAVKHGLLLGTLLLLGLCGSVIPVEAQTKTTNLVTFDNLPDRTWLPPGYAGLQWGNLVAMGEGDSLFGDGYRNGMVSAPNVVFNPYGDNASISSLTPFDFISAYLTAGVVSDMSLEVQGYTETNLVYDQTYDLDMSGPTLLTFKYQGVTSVKFIAGTEFAMDNLTVAVLSNAMQTPIDLGQVEVSSVGHLFVAQGQDTNGPDPGPPATVKDYLVDQSQNSGGGAVLPAVTADFDTNDQYQLTISAPPGKQFLVHLPSSEQPVYMVAYFYWEITNYTGNDAVEGETNVVTFGGLSGPAPPMDSGNAWLSYSHGAFGFDQVLSGAITNDITFSSITFTATVPDANIGSGPLNYAPLGNDLLSFVYQPSQTNDPGPFVSIIDEDQALVGMLPNLSIGTGQNGDITLTFFGTLQSSSQITGPYADVAGNPQGTYTIPNASLGTQSFFRSVSAPSH